MGNGKLLLVAAVAVVAICNLRPTFVPPPTQRTVPAACAVAAMAALSAPAYADIDSAAKKLAATSYPFLKEIDWSSPIYGSLPGASNTGGAFLEFTDAVKAAAMSQHSLDL